MLLGGLLLFLSAGILLLLIILGLEYFLWLNSTGRLLLLTLAILIEVFLLYWFVLIPLFYLFHLRKGLSRTQASALIGKHFPSVGDRLQNLVELAENKSGSELLIASIEQRSTQLEDVPFVKAVDFREALFKSRYLGFIALILMVIWASGEAGPFFDSYQRVVNYKLAYAPPAPFRFVIETGDLDVLENTEHTVYVTTAGDVKPENVFIHINGEEQLLQEVQGAFQYTFTPPLRDQSFYFTASGVRSQEFTLNAIEVPVIQQFTMNLKYPAYLGMGEDILNGTGNATIPEGTLVSWDVTATSTDRVSLKDMDSIDNFTRDGMSFSFNRKIFENLNYSISTSNHDIKDFDKLKYQLTVIKDAYPRINVVQTIDSLQPQLVYFEGKVADDYGLSKLRMITYPLKSPDSTQLINIPVSSEGNDTFYYTFPSGLELEEDVDYEIYFEVTDNDGLRGGKSSRSNTFRTSLLGQDKIKESILFQQQQMIEELGGNLQENSDQQKKLKEMLQGQREKENLEFNDRSRLKDMLQRQEAQQGFMEKFSRELKETLKRDNNDKELNRLLAERLERKEIEARKNEALLQELQKLADKIEKEDLAKRLEELSKQQQKGNRDMRQLLELTKRYYVTEQSALLGRKLEKLGDEQIQVSEENYVKDSSAIKQQGLNQEFDSLSKELNELKKDNLTLQKPLDLGIDNSLQDQIDQHQESALDSLSKHSQSKPSSQSPARENQKSAGSKMKSAGQELQESAMSGGGGGADDTEDAAMLRQILDNLITFSFKQENLYDLLESSDLDLENFSMRVKDQQELRTLFEHVDDSLFALSLRRAELSEFVNEQVSEVYYNIDKAVESIADDQIYQGVSYQLFVLNAANSLAAFLATILDNMQHNLSMGSSGGSGDSFQLPDIIRSQGSLGEKMSGAMGEGKESPGEGSNGKDGQKGEGKDGKQEGEGTGQDADGQGKGMENSGGQGSGAGQGEEGLEEIFEIYKQQQMIREQLEKQLADIISASDKQLAKKLILQMEDFERDLLENGITQRGINKVNRIQHELLKLEDASLQQGRKPERESKSNNQRFRNPILSKPSHLDNSGPEIEILERDALPLRGFFIERVNSYFQSDD